MKDKIIKWLLLISILLFSSINIIIENEEISVKYVAVLISIATSLFSVLCYRIVYIFLLKVFNLYSKTDEQYLAIMLYMSIFINIVTAFFVKGSTFEFIAPVLYTHFKKKNNEQKQLVLFYVTFYFINSIGVLLTLGVT